MEVGEVADDVQVVLAPERLRPSACCCVGARGTIAMRSPAYGSTPLLPLCADTRGYLLWDLQVSSRWCVKPPVCPMALRREIRGTLAAKPCPRPIIRARLLARSPRWRRRPRRHHSEGMGTGSAARRLCSDQCDRRRRALAPRPRCLQHPRRSARPR